MMASAQNQPALAEKEMVEPGALIAEFAGQCHVAMKATTFDVRREVQECPERAVVTGRTVELRCECGQRIEWGAPAIGDPIAYRYWHRESADARQYHLSILRTPLEAPPCEHWLQVPLKMDPA